MWSFLGSHDCLFCYHNGCLFMRGSQVKLKINGFFFQKWLLEWGIVQSISIDGYLQDNITGWEWKVSVQLMYYWTSTSVLLGCGLGAAVILPVENQVNITIFQYCCHITFHTIYEWLDCAISRAVYGPKHSWAINDCDIWLDGSHRYLNLRGFLQCRFGFSQSYVPCSTKYWWWICRQFTGQYGIEVQGHIADQ